MKYSQWVCRCGAENSPVFRECKRCGLDRSESEDRQGRNRVVTYTDKRPDRGAS